MFTGIIQGQGQVVNVNSAGLESRISIKSLFKLDNVQLGESIAVNGVCLTVENYSSHIFQAYASNETLNSTTLANLKAGDYVNLERALALGDRLGGHLVSGHVDTIAIVKKISAIGLSRCVNISFADKYQQEIICKGSVCLDGISLTINNCGSDFLEVNVIPETWTNTTIKNWSVGTKINLETDLIGKYVRHMLKPWQNERANATKPEGIDLEFLQKHGF